jgi:hypothetical protein
VVEHGWRSISPAFYAVGQRVKPPLVNDTSAREIRHPPAARG